MFENRRADPLHHFTISGECRNNRKWQYETSDIDGEPGTHYENPYLVNPVVRKPLPAS